MVQLEFKYFHTFDLDRPIAMATSPVRQNFWKPFLLGKSELVATYT